MSISRPPSEHDTAAPHPNNVEHAVDAAAGTKKLLFVLAVYFTAASREYAR
jgi:hypothetical protein